MTIVLTIEERMKVRNCCLECGRVLEVGDHPWCHGDPDKHVKASLGRGADVTWPGGKTFENLGDQPVTFYSPAEKARYMKAHGIEEFVRHQPVPGSDRSPHTTRWTAVPDLDGARRMLERIAHQSGHDPSGETWVTEWVPSTDVGVTRVRGRL